MHNIDRTQLEWSAGETAYETFPEVYGETNGEYGATYGEGPFSEADEMELAAQMLEVTDEAELDQFLGGLLSKATKAVGGFLKSPVGRSLGGMLKGVAKKALPMVGGALGSFIPIPGVGTALGSALGQAAGSMFGLELEGMSPEDQEFEVARRFVRLAGTAAQQAAQTPPSTPPAAAAQAALAAAAQQHAPGLVGGAVAPTGPVAPGAVGRTGRWVRRGRKIIILGV